MIAMARIAGEDSSCVPVAVPLAASLSPSPFEAR